MRERRTPDDDRGVDIAHQERLGEQQDLSTGTEGVDVMVCIIH